jgi:hypothetical protein
MSPSARRGGRRADALTAIRSIGCGTLGGSCGFFNPLARWMISTGIPTGAPNVLLTVRGRRSGEARTVLVAMLELDGAWFVQACFGEAGWVANGEQMDEW